MAGEQEKDGPAWDLLYGGSCQAHYMLTTYQIGNICRGLNIGLGNMSVIEGSGNRRRIDSEGLG